MTEKVAQQTEWPDYDGSKVAVRKWLFELGEGFERTCRLLTSNDGARFHVYEIRIKEKTGSQGGVLLMLKAFGEDGAVIAFHQDNSILQAFLNIGSRIANGSLEFAPDLYPPKEYDKMALEYLARVEYFREKIAPA